MAPYNGKTAYPMREAEDGPLFLIGFGQEKPVVMPNLRFENLPAVY